MAGPREGKEQFLAQRCGKNYEENTCRAKRRLVKNKKETPGNRAGRFLCHEGYEKTRKKGYGGLTGLEEE